MGTLLLSGTGRVKGAVLVSAGCFDVDADQRQGVSVRRFNSWLHARQ